jgi:hypothetical protein
MSYEKPTNETEILSADEEKLREMCLSLKRVDAPGDFDFKLKARIANSKAGDFAPRSGFALRYAMPALALILVLGILAYTGGFWSSADNQIAVEKPAVESAPVAAQNPTPQTPAVSNFAPAEKKEELAENSPALPSNQSSPKAPEPEVAGRRPRDPKKEQPKNKKDSGGGSVDIGVKPPVLRQPNFNANSFDPVSRNIEKAVPMPVKEVLSQMGINSSFENGKWTVKSVTTNSLAEGSDVKAGDIIEAINNQPLAAGPIDGNVSGKTFTVTRNGEKLVLKIRNKQ